MNKNNVYVEILVGGKPIKEHSAEVNNGIQTFVEGKIGSNYSIKINNGSGEKLLAIVAIDGLNCVSGKPCDGISGRGYICPRGEVIEIQGFRISDSEIAKFQFSDKNQGYAATKGKTRNSGVISVNLIKEKQETLTINTSEGIKTYPKPNPLPYYPPYPSPYPVKPYKPTDFWYATPNDDCLNTPSYRTRGMSLGNENQTKSLSVNYMAVVGPETPISSPDLGTAFGAKTLDTITRKHFEKGEIHSTFNIYYGSRKFLEEIGVEFKPKKIVDLPTGFSDKDYCQPPANWKY